MIMANMNIDRRTTFGKQVVAAQKKLFGRCCQLVTLASINPKSFWYLCVCNAMTRVYTGFGNKKKWICKACGKRHEHQN